MKFNTKLIHGYPVIDKETGAASIPLYQTSTFHQSDIDQGQPFTYSRFGNPTREALEKGIAAIETGGTHGFAFASGMAAITTVLLSFSKGDHLVMCQNIYGGTFQLVQEVFPRFGIEVTFVDETNLAAWQEAIQANTKAFYLETPSNPLLSITDIEGVANIAKQNHLTTIMDGTFMTPQLQEPLTLGVDIVIHSATKFLNGHSDVIAGLVVTNNNTWAETLHTNQKVFGGILGTEDCWLVLRGMKTMGLRMNQSTQSAQAIAELLEKHPKVNRVYYPGLPSHPGYATHKKQAKNGGAVLSFELADGQAARNFFNATTVPITAVSLGGVESILSYPVTMSHACVPENERLAQGITDGLIRLSVGIEDTEDLLQDLQQALNTI